MFDAVAGLAACGPQRGEGDDQLSVGDAVQRDGDVVVVVVGHPFGELVDVEPVVVQNPLTRARGSAAAAGSRRADAQPITSPRHRR